MKLERIRVQHFQCIADTGELPIDDRLTVLIGANGSGKSAILRALWHFNPENNFQPVDVSTISGIRERLEKMVVAPSEIEVVTLWVTFSTEDLIKLGLSDQMDLSPSLRIAKTLDNEYRLELHKPLREAATTRHQKLVQFVNELRSKIQNVYTGRVKRKLPTDSFAWLESYEREDLGDNLVLFPEWAPAIWDDLEAGDWIQSTRLAPDPYGRNTRALNAGFKHDVEPIVSCLSRMIEALQSRKEPDSKAFQDLQGKVGEIPSEHPLTLFLNSESLGEISRLSQPGEELEIEPSAVLRRVKDLLPHFVYLPSVQAISDSISLRSLGGGPAQEPEVLLGALAAAVGLQSNAITQDDVINRKKVLEQKSTLLSMRLREHWVDKELSLEFEKQGQRLALWVAAGGSLDPPSRRSAGLGNYISLFAKLSSLSSSPNVVTLLDDPGVYLHPVAQKELLPLLNSQPFQIIMATHLPFMIDPDHIEGVRVVMRAAAGTKVEGDWAKAKDTLLPLWGSLIGGNAGRVWLVVEGKDDKRAYKQVSKACAAAKKQHLPEDMPIISGGGDSVPYVVEELLSHGIPTIVLLDGDDKGRVIKQKVLRLRTESLKGVVRIRK